MATRELTWDERVDALIVALKVKDVKSGAWDRWQIMQGIHDGSIPTVEFHGTRIDLGAVGSPQRLELLRLHMDEQRIPHTIEEPDDGADHAHETSD